MFSDGISFKGQRIEMCDHHDNADNYSDGFNPQYSVYNPPGQCL